MRKSRLNVLLLFLLPFSVMSVQGQDPDEWEVSLFVGMSGTDSGTFTTPVVGAEFPQNVELDFSESYAAGGRISQNMGSRFAGEVEYVFANQPGQFKNLSSTIPVLDFSQKIHKFSYNMVFLGGDRDAKVRPFVLAGVGGSFFQVTSSSKEEARRLGANLDSRLKMAFSFGGGVKFKIHPMWGLRADFRNYMTGVPDYDLPSEAAFPGLPAIAVDGVQHNWYGSFGINFYLFGE